MYHSVRSLYGCDVRVDEDDLAAHLLERLDGLRARVVELARLADREAAGAEEQHLAHRRLRNLVGDSHLRDTTDA